MAAQMTDLKEVLGKIHLALAEDLLKRVTTGEATAAELNVVRQFLKDNHVDTVPQKGDAVDNLVHALPFTEEDDDSAYVN